MKLLITGGAGFIGRWVVGKLLCGRSSGLGIGRFIKRQL